MVEYVYKGKTRSNKTVKGTLEAADEVEARIVLRERQIRPTALYKKGGIDLNMDLGEMFSGIPVFQPSVSLKDLVIFTRQFSVMIDSGLPQVMALDVLSKQSENPALKKILTTVKTNVEQGNSLKAALGNHPHVFDKLYQNLVGAGESGGVLDVILRRLADYLEKTASIINKVKSALLYPAAVIVIAILVVWGLLTFVVPKFAEFIQSAGGQMPEPTKILISISNFCQANLVIIVAAFVGTAFLIRYLYKNPISREIFDQQILHVPVFGDLVKKASVARFTRTMGILIQSGVPIIESLDICARIAGNSTIEKTLMTAKEAVSEGKPITVPLEASGIFPPMVVQMIGVGEKTGALDQMLSKVSDFYDQEVDDSVKALTTLIEPILMVVLGAIVGGILIALYLPIFKLAGNVQT